MSRPLRVLIVEDSELDAELVLRELRRGGAQVTHLRVQTAETMRLALAEPWDIILADYALPGFSALGAVNVLKQSGLDIPLIVISGTIGEETAVEALKAGAHDFLLKGRLARLMPAIERELREAQVRRERKEAIERLREAIRARDDFLSIASHELKTPLTSLELHLTTLLKLVRVEGTAASPQKLERKLEASVGQVERLTALINNLLDVIQITSGRLNINRVKLDLAQLVEDVLFRYREMLKRSGSEIRLLAERPLLGFWDAAGLESVVSNLLSNAAKFGEGRPIEIHLSATEDSAHLEVKDQGIGMAAEEQARIFQRFERAVSSRHYGGFGLGLWVTRQVIEAHGGRIHVQSQKGQGASFKIDLPVMLRAASPEEPVRTENMHS